MQKKGNKAFILDRDGVISPALRRHQYCYRVEDFKFLPRVFPALKRAQSPDRKLVIITNQSGIGRGIFTLDDFLSVTDYMLSCFEEEKIEIDKIYYCPHPTEENCKCRKPKTYLLEQAIQELDLNPEQCWVIGDELVDMEMSARMNIRRALVKSQNSPKDYPHTPEFPDLYSAVSYILNQEKNHKTPLQ